MAKSNDPIQDKQKYNPSEIEAKWQKIWEEVGIYKPNLDTAKKPFYNLMMFPYPSAEGLHVGNMYAFTGADTYGRFKRMQGNDVFEPIGLDGFGIHSENYAIKVGRHPKEQAEVSEKNFYRQLHSIGNGFDWNRKLETYDPNYYKWTQWIFIQLFKKGLAYRKKAPVNFCPKDLTVLADEQVIDGKCERCGSIVEKRQLEQWFFKITTYADRLLNNIPKLNWTKKVKIAQEEWIGRSEGIRLEFKIQNSKFKIDVFTTAVDTVYGVTFMVVSPQHSILKSLDMPKESAVEVQKYIEEHQKETEVKDKTGVSTGLYVINPLTNEKVPLWVADYVLMGYGTGAVMGVPGHDARDYEFAKKYKLPIKPVIKPTDEETKVEKDGFWDYDDIKKNRKNSIMFNSNEFEGKRSDEAKLGIIELIENKGFGKKETNYHLRDWLISRQRYWGPPIPMIYCDKCEWQPVPEDQLPVLLPDVKDWKPKGDGTSPLANMKDFVNTTCPNCKGPARRETDVSDTFLDSSWYFFRYISTDAQNKVFDTERAKKWLPVSIYIGGAEHSVLHLLYSRFITMVFYDLGLISFEEPYARFYAHGLIIKDGAKMSKSKGNIINPDEYIKKYGADTLRTYLRFVGPFDMGGDFRDSGIEGMFRFLKRVWKLVSDNVILSETKDLASVRDSSPSAQNDINRAMHRTIKKVTEDLEALRYNTAVAAIMEYYNEISNLKSQISKIHIETLLLLLAPFAPHISEELFQNVILSETKDLASVRDSSPSAQNDNRIARNDNFSSIHLHPWPDYDPKMLEEDELTIVVQINGKVRDSIKIQNSKLKTQNEIDKLVRESEKVKKYLEGKKIEKIIYVPGKIISYSVGE